MLLLSNYPDICVCVHQLRFEAPGPGTAVTDDFPSNGGGSETRTRSVSTEGMLVIKMSNDSPLDDNCAAAAL